MRILAQFRLWVNFCESILEEPNTFTDRVNFLNFFQKHKKVQHVKLVCGLL